MPGWGLISSTLSPRGWDPTGPPAWGVRQSRLSCGLHPRADEMGAAWLMGPAPP